MKLNQIRSSLEGLGTELDVLYTNEEIIDNLDELQRAMASGLFAATHVEYARARDIMAGIERLAIEQGLETSPEFQRLNSNMNYLGYTIGSLIKGRTGERNTMKALQLLALDKNVRILYNIAIQDGEAQTEYDAIVLAPYGVFAVEVKNYNESILDKLELSTQISDRLVLHLGRSIACGGKIFKNAFYASQNFQFDILGTSYHAVAVFQNHTQRMTTVNIAMNGFVGENNLHGIIVVVVTNVLRRKKDAAIQKVEVMSVKEGLLYLFRYTAASVLFTGIRFHPIEQFSRNIFYIANCGVHFRNTAAVFLGIGVGDLAERGYLEFQFSSVAHCFFSFTRKVF